MRDLKADLEKLIKTGKESDVMSEMEGYQICIEAINRAIAAEQANETYLKIIEGQKDTIMGCNRVYGELQDENARLTAQVAGLREAIQDALYHIEYGDTWTFDKLKNALASPDPGEKYREVVEAAKDIMRECENCSGPTKYIKPGIGCIDNCTYGKLRQALAELEGDV